MNAETPLRQFSLGFSLWFTNPCSLGGYRAVYCCSAVEYGWLPLDDMLQRGGTVVQIYFSGNYCPLSMQRWRPLSPCNRLPRCQILIAHDSGQSLLVGGYDALFGVISVTVNTTCQPPCFTVVNHMILSWSIDAEIESLFTMCNPEQIIGMNAHDAD